MKVLMDDRVKHELLVERLRVGDETMEKNLADVLKEKRRLESELAKVELQRPIASRQLEEAKRLMRRERMQTRLVERRNRVAKQTLDIYLNDMPMNFRRETLAKLATLEAPVSVSSDSNVEVDVTTDSAKSSSYVPSISSSQVPPLTEESDLEQAFCKRISSSTESECSSVQLLSGMLEALKKRRHTLRDHCFMLGNKCCVCDKKFVCGRMELECKDCHAFAHKRCCERLVPPCIPTKNVSLRKVSSPSAANYCSPGFRPQIPAFVLHSVLTVESSGLHEERLYLLPDYSHQTTTLKQQLENVGYIANLSRLQASTVCELLKHFLGKCIQPLIQDRLYDELENFNTTKKSAESDLARFYDLMLKAPEAERATLCMIILHLKKVCDSPECKVSAKSLAKIFAPILVRNFNTEAAFNEKKKRYAVVQKLLSKIPDNFYECVLKDLF